MERAMGIEPTSEAWEANFKSEKTHELAAFLRFSSFLKWIPIGAAEGNSKLSLRWLTRKT